MAYIDQDRKAVIQAALKPILKKYGVRGTLSIRNHMTIVLTVKSGKIDFIDNFNRVAGQKYGDRFSPAAGSIQVNTYWFKDHFDGLASDFIQDALTVLKSGGWYDNSDAMTDYFDTAYYIDINIGRWDRNYVLE